VAFTRRKEPRLRINGDRRKPGYSGEDGRKEGKVHLRRRDALGPAAALSKNISRKGDTFSSSKAGFSDTWADKQTVQKGFSFALSGPKIGKC